MTPDSNSIVVMPPVDPEQKIKKENLGALSLPTCQFSIKLCRIITNVKDAVFKKKVFCCCSTSNSFDNLCVYVFSVNDCKYPHFISLNFVDYPVITDS